MAKMMKKPPMTEEEKAKLIEKKKAELLALKKAEIEELKKKITDAHARGDAAEVARLLAEAKAKKSS